MLSENPQLNKKNGKIKQQRQESGESGMEGGYLFLLVTKIFC